MQDIYQKIVGILNSVPAELPDAFDEDWTRCIKEKLATLGGERDHVVYANGVTGEHVRGEWIYDLAWVADAGKGQAESSPRRIVLACECKWARSFGDIWDDFDKLLQARADYRIFITHEFGDESAESITDKLVKRIRDFEQTTPGDTYLLAVYEKKSGTFAAALTEILHPNEECTTRLVI
ncbi:hypothetical protein ACSHT0_12555 [Tepidicaulis sp. LMO-SS28]|uniref:hypothetical protein n=1 Tax=Tepidicaulis sp. LMO-SS28 TaxID=3447455 RepID=UPI003EE31D92